MHSLVTSLEAMHGVMCVHIRFLLQGRIKENPMSASVVTGCSFYIRPCNNSGTTHQCAVKMDHLNAVNNYTPSR